MDWANLLNLLYKGDYQTMTFGISPRPDPVFAYIYTKYNGFDDQFPRMKQLRDEAQGTIDFQARKKLFEEAHQLTYQGVPAIVFFNYNYFHAYWKHLKGYNIWNTNFPRFWGVWLEK